MAREAGFLQKLLTTSEWRKKGREGGDYTEWDRQVGVVELPWSSIPPMPSILPCHPPHLDRCSPGCPWRPCSISRAPPISAVLPMLGLPPTPPAPRLPPISLMPPSFSVLTGQPCRPSYLRASMRPCYPCSTVHAEKLRRNLVGLFMLKSFGARRPKQAGSLRLTRHCFGSLHLTRFGPGQTKVAADSVRVRAPGLGAAFMA
jgi:hypothetical protein